MNNTSVPITAVIIARDEAHNIANCIAPLLGWVDEILLVDSGSTDDTVNIAQSLGATVLSVQWKTYADSRNAGANKARNNWILALDADEVVSSSLAKSIQTLLATHEPAHPVYAMPRLTHFCGQPIRHCGWYPDLKFRLYNREKATWQGEFVHEKLTWSSNEEPVVIQGDLLHYSFPTRADHEQKILRYAQLGAEKVIASGNHNNLMFKQFTHSLWRLIRGYLLQGGFREGRNGWIVCTGMAREVWLKYHLAREQITRGRGAV